MSVTGPVSANRCSYTDIWSALEQLEGKFGQYNQEEKSANKPKLWALNTTKSMVRIFKNKQKKKGRA